MEGKGGGGNTTSTKFQVQKNSPWIKNNRQAKVIDPRLWEDDLLIRVPRVSELIVNKLKNEKITTAGKLKNLPVYMITRLVSASISRPSLETTTINFMAALPVVYPNLIIYHRNNPSSYMPRYPDAAIYKEMICNSSIIKPFVCITHLMSWIMEDSKRFRIDSK